MFLESTGLVHAIWNVLEPVDSLLDWKVLSSVVAPWVFGSKEIDRPR